MAQTGRRRRQRAGICTRTGIVVLSTLGGLLGSVTVGGLIAFTPVQPAGAGAPSIPKGVVAKGEAALLQLSDLPSGWVSGATGATPARVAPWSATLAHCVGVRGSITSLKPVKVNSPDFTSADHELAVVDSVSVYPSGSGARAAYAAMAKPKTTRCMNTIAGPALQSGMQQQAAGGTAVGSATFAGLPPGAAASHVTGFTVTIPLTTGGRQITVTSTQFDFVQGALLHQITFNGNGTTFPAELEIQLLTTANHRG